MIILETYWHYIAAVFASWHFNLIVVMAITAAVMWVRRAEFARFGLIRLGLLLLANTAFNYVWAIWLILALPFIAIAFVLDRVFCGDVRRRIDRVAAS